MTTTKDGRWWQVAIGFVGAMWAVMIALVVYIHHSYVVRLERVEGKVDAFQVRIENASTHRAKLDAQLEFLKSGQERMLAILDRVEKKMPGGK